MPNREPPASARGAVTGFRVVAGVEVGTILVAAMPRLLYLGPRLLLVIVPLMIATVTAITAIRIRAEDRTLGFALAVQMMFPALAAAAIAAVLVGSQWTYVVLVVPEIWFLALLGLAGVLFLVRARTRARTSFKSPADF